MANNEIKQKIVLEGEQQYKNAIKDAQRNLKTLRSELKAETAELGKNATEQNGYGLGLFLVKHYMDKMD